MADETVLKKPTYIHKMGTSSFMPKATQCFNWLNNLNLYFQGNSYIMFWWWLEHQTGLMTRWKQVRWAVVDTGVTHLHWGCAVVTFACSCEHTQTPHCCRIPAPVAPAAAETGMVWRWRLSCRQLGIWSLLLGHSNVHWLEHSRECIIPGESISCFRSKAQHAISPQTEPPHSLAIHTAKYSQLSANTDLCLTSLSSFPK